MILHRYLSLPIDNCHDSSDSHLTPALLVTAHPTPLSQALNPREGLAPELSQLNVRWTSFTVDRFIDGSKELYT